MKSTKKSAKFTDAELGAMKDRVRELKADKADGESGSPGMSQPYNAGVPTSWHPLCDSNQRQPDHQALTLWATFPC